MPKSFVNILLSAAVGLLLLLPSVVLAQSMLAQARGFLETNQPQEAIDLSMQFPSELALDASLIRARGYLELGQATLARTAAQSATRIAPKSYDAWFLLASANARLGEQIQAKWQFRRAIDLANNAAQRQLAVSAIARLDASRAINWSGSIGLAPSSNLNKASSSDQVELVFGTSDISDKPRGDVGVTYSVAASFPKSEGISIGVNGLLAENVTDRQTGFVASLRTTGDDGNALNMTFQSRWARGDHFQDRIALSTESAFLGLDNGSFGIEAISYSSGARELDLFGSFQKTLVDSDSTSVLAEVRIKRHNSDSAEHASLSTGVSLFALTEVGKLDVQLGATLNRRTWDDVWSLFVVPRQDQDTLFSFSVKNPEISYFGLNPVVRGSFMKRESNIALYSFQSRDFYLGVEKSF